MKANSVTLYSSCIFCVPIYGHLCIKKKPKSRFLLGLSQTDTGEYVNVAACLGTL